MPKVTNFQCDCCKKIMTEAEHNNQHWSSTWGRVVLSFKDIPGSQHEYNFDLLCFGCASALEDEVKKAINIWLKKKWKKK